MPADPPETPPGWITTTVAVLFFGGLVVVAFLIDQRRRRGFSELESRLGLTYHDSADHLITLPESLILAKSPFWRGDAEARRGLTGEIDGVECAVFELVRISDPSKGETRGYATTVAQFGIAELGLPDFLLRPERWGQRIGAVLSGDDIDFPDSYRFSRLFRLRGEDEEAVRRVFTREIRAFFERHPCLIAQTVGGQLFVWRRTRWLRLAAFRPGPARALLSEGLQLVSLLRDAATRGPAWP